MWRETQERRNSRRVDGRDSNGEAKDILFLGRKTVILLEDSQASPAWLSDKGSMKVKAFKC
jgi:hypothetical protein